MSASDDDNRVSISIVQYLSPANSGSCGYCKRGRYKKKDSQAAPPPEPDEPSFSLGVWAHHLSVEVYQKFCDHGWRRSGKYLYKPIMDKTCCPQYTIRLDVHKFHLSRTHKRVLRNMHNFLKYGKRPDRRIVDPMTEEVSSPTTSSGQQHALSAPGAARQQEKPVRNVDQGTQPRAEKGVKKKDIRRQRAIDRLVKKGENIFEYQRQRRLREESRQRTIQSFVENYNEGEWAHNLEIRIVQKGTPEFERSLEESYNLFVKYQRTVHDDTNSTRKGYEGFLISSPLMALPADRLQLPVLGSYHQQYLLDGKIIAVGVIDLLPRCLSSKYFYYDPDYNFLTMGTYSALREIAYTQELANDRPTLRYYYMGYYLQECPKMRYKGKFKPSELLCDKTFQWMPLEQAVEKIVANDSKFTVFYPETPRPPPPNFSNIRCMLRDRVLMWPKLREELARCGKGVEFDERIMELSHYMSDVIESVVIFFPTLTTNQIVADSDDSSELDESTEQNDD